LQVAVDLEEDVPVAKEVGSAEVIPVDIRAEVSAAAITTALEVDIRKAGDSEVKAVLEEAVSEAAAVASAEVKAVSVAVDSTEAVAVSAVVALAVVPLRIISRPHLELDLVPVSAHLSALKSVDLSALDSVGSEVDSSDPRLPKVVSADKV
jgi:hypothetical protein